MLYSVTALFSDSDNFYFSTLATKVHLVKQQDIAIKSFET